MRRLEASPNKCKWSKPSKWV